MRSLRSLLIVCLLIIGSLSVEALASEYSAGSSSVLRVGRSVRSAALGSASATLNRSAESAIWNPALLARLDRQSLSVSHLRLFESSELNAIAWGGRFDGFGSVGAHLMRFGSEPFEEVSAWTSTGREIHYSAMRAAVGYGRALGAHLDFGVAGVVVAEELLDSRDAGFGVDAGLLVHADKLQAAAVVRNLLAPKLQLGSRGERLNRIALVGASYNQLQLGTELSLTGALELRLEESRDPTVHAGIELDVTQRLCIRGGVSDGELTFGAGIPLGSTTIDYAYEALNNLDASHRFGFSFGFGPTRSERERVRQSRREAIGLAYAAHERQARAQGAFNRGEEFENARQLDSAAVYFQLALALEPDNEARRAALLAVESRLNAVRDSSARAEATLRGTGSERLPAAAGALVVVERLVSENEFAAAEALLGSLDTESLDSVEVAGLRSNLQQRRERWRAENAALADGAARDGAFVVAFERYSALNREFPENTDYRAELSELVGRMKSQDLIDRARAALDAGRADQARSSIGAALALDPTNSAALALLAELDAHLPSGGLEEISADPASWEKMSEALRLVRVGELTEALRLLDELLERYPNNSEILRNKSQIELRLSAPKADD